MKHPKKEHNVHIEIFEEKKTGNKHYPLSSLFAFVLGICGFFLIIASYVSNPYNNMIVFLPLPFLGAGLWHINQKQKNLIRLFHFAVIAASIIFFVKYMDYIIYEATILAGELGFNFNIEASQNADMTHLMVLIAIASAYLMFFLALILKAHWAAFLITSILALLCPVCGRQPSLFGIAFLTVFFVISSFSIEKTGVKPKKILAGHDWNSVSQENAFFIPTLILIFGAAFVLTVMFSEPLSAAMLRVDRFISEKGEELFRQEGDNGFINRGDLYQNTEDVRLTVTVTKKPTENIYLKGYQGHIYTGSSWDEDTEDLFYDGVTYVYHEFLNSNLLSAEEFFIDLPFKLNTRVKYNSYEWYVYNAYELSSYDIRKMVIANSDFSKYRPYFAAEVYDSVLNASSLAESDTYFYYESSELNNNYMDWTQITDKNIERLMELYDSHARSDYLDVPVQRIPRLAALCSENPHTGVQDVTAFIKTSLSSLASYTTAPGMAPANKDIIEYTFFDRKVGYCVHYASAAVLMYRMYGIPARYVSGYVIRPAEFTEQSDGTYAAYPTDGNSHAWVEIYEQGMGWIPIEVTPAYSGNNLIQENNTPDIADNTSPALEQPTSASGHQSENPTSQSGVSQNQNEATGISLKVIADKLILLLQIFAIPAVFMVIALLARHRRKMLLKRQKSYHVRVLFSRMLQICGIKGILVGYIGLEDDFAEAFSRQFPLIKEEETAEILRIVHDAAYGDIRPQKEEQLSVLRFYRKMADDVYEKLNPLQKFWFKWIKVWN